MNPGHIEIHRMDIHLPPGLKSRAENISRELGRALGQLTIHRQMVIQHLDLPELIIRPEESDRALAARLARRIGQAIDKA